MLGGQVREAQFSDYNCQNYCWRTSLVFELCYITTQIFRAGNSVHVKSCMPRETFPRSLFFVSFIGKEPGDRSAARVQNGPYLSGCVELRARLRVPRRAPVCVSWPHRGLLLEVLSCASLRLQPQGKPTGAVVAQHLVKTEPLWFWGDK